MWSASARAADVIVVMFTPAYKARFTAALRMEAELIYKLYMQGTAVYVFESETMAAAEVRVLRIVTEPPRGGELKIKHPGVSWEVLPCGAQPPAPQPPPTHEF